MLGLYYAFSLTYLDLDVARHGACACPLPLGAGGPCPPFLILHDDVEHPDAGVLSPFGRWYERWLPLPTARGWDPRSRLLVAFVIVKLCAVASRLEHPLHDELQLGPNMGGNLLVAVAATTLRSPEDKFGVFPFFSVGA